MSVETTSVTPGHPAHPSYSPAQVEQWIDENTRGPENLISVIEQLTAWTLPPKPWLSGTFVNPLQGNLDVQSWPWNRAAGNLLDGGYAEQAAQVWSAWYLAYLSLQRQYQQRYHKGTPLCNIGLASIRAQHREVAIKSWLLGLVEDTLTTPEQYHEFNNYRNLTLAGLSPPVLHQLAATVASRFLNEQIIPACPETVIDLWLHPGAPAPSEQCLREIERLGERLDNAYPNLPEPANPWGTLSEFWSFLDIAKVTSRD
jgi:hypothetical protein